MQGIFISWVKALFLNEGKYPDVAAAENEILIDKSI